MFPTLMTLPRRRALALILGVAALALPGAPAFADVAATAATRCRVTNIDSGARHRSLAAAVSAADPAGGDRLRVRGICHGVTTIDRGLSIRGIRPSGAPRPTLDGDDGGAVITVTPGVTVTIATLTITDGSGSTQDCPTTCGGALMIGAGSAVTLRTVLVTGNRSSYDGAISNYGDLTLSGRTRVSGNAGTDIESYGGAIATYAGSTLVMRDRSRLSGNTGGYGGAIEAFGAVTLMDHARITGNTATEAGGGIYLEPSGSLTMLGDASIDRNTAPVSQGGGVYLDGGTTSGMVCGGNVHDNTHEDCSPT